MKLNEKKYQSIENYGIIGDLNTVALVSIEGSIDFLCFPHFDSPTIFASLLDKNIGGYFSISPHLDNIKTRQLYLPDTNVLLTRFLSPDGVGEITDFMPIEETFVGNIIRRLTNIRGKVSYRMECKPRFNYGRSKHKVEVKDNAIIFTRDGNNEIELRLISSIPLEVKDGDGYAEFTLKGNEHADFLLELSTKNNPEIPDLDKFVTENLYSTMEFWQKWVDLCSYKGRWRETVHRSALVLKLMTSQQYGSLVASPTFSLPENIGGERNWDYRFTWIRDASFTVYALINLGYKREAGNFMKWVEKQCEDIGSAGYLGLMYSINGERVMNETELDHFEGYMKSSPVRIGNNAAGQIQLDIYGELMDAVYLYNKSVEPVSYKFWTNLEKQINWLTENWHLKDEGIWEVRGGKRHFLYSRLMCWVAMDRAIRLAYMRSFPIPGNWIKTRDKIFQSIFTDFWNDKLKTFVQYKGSDTVDAATLLMPLMRFISPKDPIWISTLRMIEKKLVSDSLVYRYRPYEAADDGLRTGEGTFSMCTFWYIECLAKSGQLHKARFYFEKMLAYANHLGLYAEQLGVQGEHLGNYPQAFTHLGLISAALSLDKNLDDQRNREAFYI